MNLDAMRLCIGGRDCGSIPGGGEILHVAQTGHQALALVGAILGVKRQERGADHAPPSSSGLQKDWTYTPTSLLILHRHVMG